MNNYIKEGGNVRSVLDINCMFIHVTIVLNPSKAVFFTFMDVFCYFKTRLFIFKLYILTVDKRYIRLINLCMVTYPKKHTFNIKYIQPNVPFSDFQVYLLMTLCLAMFSGIVVYLYV